MVKKKAYHNLLEESFSTCWSLYCRPTAGIISCLFKDKALHLLDIIESKIPPLDLILDHLPTIDKIYFYFSPDRLTNAATSEPMVIS